MIIMITILYNSNNNEWLEREWLRAIPFKCTWGGGLERSPIKKSWGEGVKMKKLGVYMKKNHWGGGGRGLKLWAFHPPPPPPPPHVHSNGIALSYPASHPLEPVP